MTAMIAPPAVSARDDLNDAANELADLARVLADCECVLDGVKRHLEWATGTAHEIEPIRADLKALVAKVDAFEAIVRRL